MAAFFDGFGGSVLRVTLYLVLAVIAFCLTINLVQTVVLFVRRLRYRSSSSFREDWMDYSHFGPLNVAKWVLHDILQGKSYFRLFGIWAFTGYYGQGKSLGAVTYAFLLQRLHPEMDIKIYSNFDVQGQDGRVDCWEDMLSLPQNTILIFDEIQSTFTSTKFKDFPIELLWKLTQCRKHGLAIFCTTPVYNRMTIQLRESVDYVIECKNVLGLDRYFRYTFFRAPDYELAQSLGGMFADVQRRRLVEMTRSVVARDCDYARYDTNAQIDRWDIVDEESAAKVCKPNLKQIEDSVYKRVMFEIDRRGGCSGKR